MLFEGAENLISNLLDRRWFLLEFLNVPLWFFIIQMKRPIYEIIH